MRKKSLQIEWPQNNCNKTGHCYAILQVTDILTPEQKQALASLGIEVFGFIPDAAYLASYSGSEFQTLQIMSWMSFLLWNGTNDLIPPFNGDGG
ncbi:MAG: hypothetical protein R2795_04585 [Saprospiraceae bacterium]